MSSQDFFGILNIDKPAGITSRKVVDRVARIVKPAKAGHAGTLDPLATGVLVVCVGQATRLIPFIQERSKEYRAQFLLGRRSNTDDVTGDLVEVSDAQPVTREMVETLLGCFVGEIEQIPPQFSAVHVDGQRAYKLARRGQKVNVKSKRVKVDRIDLIDFEYPRLELEIECGSGTYVRSVARDLGERLGSGAVLSELERVRVGPYRLAEAADFDQLGTRYSLAKFLLPATSAVEQLSTHVCPPCELDAIRAGRVIRAKTPPNPPLAKGGTQGGVADEVTVAVLTPDGQLACLAKYRKQDRSLAPMRVFLQQSPSHLL